MQCQYCDAWIHKGTITRHIKNQHQLNNSVVCPYCNSRYKNEASLSNHIRIKHHVFSNKMWIYKSLISHVLLSFLQSWSVHILGWIYWLIHACRFCENISTQASIVWRWSTEQVWKDIFRTNIVTSLTCKYIVRFATKCIKTKILQGLGVGPGSVTERWPCRKFNFFKKWHQSLVEYWAVNSRIMTENIRVKH